MIEPMKELWVYAVLDGPHGRSYVRWDERDAAILLERIAELDAVDGPRCGDFVRFADGVLRRISHLWQWGDPTMDGAQTSDGGSWYLGHGYTSFSGSLYPIVRFPTLTLTDETRMGSVWFFHRDHHSAHNGVDVMIPFRVYECSEVAS
jgi:hypothetical protein